MQLFSAFKLQMALQDLWMMESATFSRTLYEGKGVEVPPDGVETTKGHLQKLLEVCRENGFDHGVSAAMLAEDHLSQKPLDGSSLSADLVHAELRTVREAVLYEMYAHKFITIPEESENLVDQKSLFGDDVHASFPSAHYDIRESGNCLAVGCSTAAVFHLMRVVEHGLRALAYDRRIKMKKGPIELATWEDIIKQLESAEQAIQGYPKTLAREAQFDFYHGAMLEFRRLKNKFRNQVMHTRDEYDESEARSAFGHVKAFMQILARKIAEGKRTPMIWKKP